MFSIYLLMASMLLKLIATTAIFHSSDQIASVGENTIMKSGHQHRKRMQYAKKTPSDISGKPTVQLIVQNESQGGKAVLFAKILAALHLNIWN
ncbi:hypothetical protein PGTUg99_031671 [Puccinia graminis f. sp. tritici]|uniref:Secreted protein n=1 Tax=Puccinia graminis f. sp. tritici TaxID=56615 RepID=A0A5B0SL36_PUCGR|nr:hypothetical protein PGTUg99_031671 [Puccinia graminis f. sp. tritici]